MLTLKIIKIEISVSLTLAVPHRVWGYRKTPGGIGSSVHDPPAWTMGLLTIVGTAVFLFVNIERACGLL